MGKTTVYLFSVINNLSTITVFSNKQIFGILNNNLHFRIIKLGE
jgi:hypothetical protein